MTINNMYQEKEIEEFEPLYYYYSDYEIEGDSSEPKDNCEDLKLPSWEELNFEDIDI